MPKKRFLVPALLLTVCLSILAGCGALSLIEQDLEPLEITSSIAYQDAETIGDTDRLVMFFAETGGGVTYEPSLYEYCSQGNTGGDTLATVTIQSSKTFYVTGARIEGLLYYLAPIGGGDPTGCGWVEYSYFDPADPAGGHDVFDPVTVGVSLRPDLFGGLNVIEVPAGEQRAFEVRFGSKISCWIYANTDRDATAFPLDNDEVIELRGSLFLEGYLADGTEFSGAFPPPFALEMIIRHDSYESE